MLWGVSGGRSWVIVRDFSKNLEKIKKDEKDFKDKLKNRKKERYERRMNAIMNLTGSENLYSAIL